MTATAPVHWDPGAELSRYFGFSSFRPGQEEIVRRVLGGEDLLVVMATGAGKSLCYQLPALIQPGLTVVVSPLIALMKDQVDALAARGIHAREADLLNSTLSPDEQRDLLERLRHKDLKLLYVAPERFRNAGFRRALAAAGVAQLVVDEAHCLSEWGHEFRPDYLKLGEVIRRLRGAGRKVQVLAFTATATPRVQAEIPELLGLPGMASSVGAFDRPNLFFEVLYCGGPRIRLQLLKEYLARHFPEKQTPGLVYCGTRAEAEAAAQFLRAETGRPAGCYHAGLTGGRREEVQERFRTGELPVVAATVAFGMGIDRADVRFVAHLSAPTSLEAYYQEAGRAGRDGQPARCALICAPEDRARLHALLPGQLPSTHELQRILAFLGQGAGPGRPGGDRVYVGRDELESALDLPETTVRLALHYLQQHGALGELEESAGRTWIELASPEASERAMPCIAQAIEARLQHRRERVEHVLRYARSGGCRRRALLSYFGTSDLTSCSHGPRKDCCDSCPRRMVFGPLAWAAPHLLLGLARTRAALASTRGSPAPAAGVALPGSWRAGLAVDLTGSQGGLQYARTEMGRLFYRYKYRDERRLAGEIARRMAAAARSAGMPLPDLMLSVPPTYAHRFDRVGELAARLGAELNVPVISRLGRLEVRHRQKYVRSAAGKRANVAGVFGVTTPAAIAGRRVLVVDDAFDSGATLEECARVLRLAGAYEVCVITAVRTAHHPTG